MRWFLWFTLAAFLFLAACSDSSSANDSEQVATDGVYPTEDDLPNCTSKLEGDSAYVEEDDAFYVCSGKSWNLVAESSSSVETKKEGLSSEKETSSSSVDKIESASSSSIEEDSEAVATSIEGVNGYMQKGPFLSGSKVRVLELESGRTLRQTGRNFETVIQTDDGKFALNAQTMVSQYIELHAEGFYRNEVTGTESEAPISLYAITDVSKRDHGLVNINLLTHLEYQRVVYLVKEKKMRVAAAKDSAQKEVLAMLGITNNKGFGSSEDLNVVGSTDADGALLAFSVLFQGNRTEAQLTSLLQGVVSDLKEDGKWDDEETKTKIADWAEAQDLGGRLTTIRGHVADWKLGSVPNFEKYVRNFWYSSYGLGECTTSDKWKIVKNKNTKSENKDVYFICEDNAWRVVSDIERDTYDYENNRPWGAGDAGEIRNGSLSNTAYVYADGWREATPFEKDTYDYENNRPWSAGERWERRKGSITGDEYLYYDNGWLKAGYYSDGLCFAGDMWGGCYETQLIMDFGDESQSSYWWTSKHDYGADVSWPVFKGDGYSDESWSSVVNYCGGICGEIWLQGFGIGDPTFFTLGFNLFADERATDVSSWEGLCVVYSSDEEMSLELSQGFGIDISIRYALPAVSLPSGINVIKDFAWSEFRMPKWAIGQVTEISGEDAAKRLVSIQINLMNQGESFLRNQFNIKAIGRKGTCQAQP